MADSKNIGIKVSQIGWDVKTAGDANLYFSSSWPILKIEKTDTVTSGAVVNHSLTYPPLALVWNPTNGLAPCTATSTTITMPTLSTQSRHFLFRLPLNRPYQSSIVHSPIQPVGAADHDFGIKFVKDGKDLTSDDFRDFTIHSSVRSPLVHAVIYDKLATIAGQSGLSLRWTSDLPYIPVFFAFYSADGNTFTPLSTVAQVAPKILVDASSRSLTVNSNNAGFGAIILLKDPLDQVNRTNVIL